MQVKDVLVLLVTGLCLLLFVHLSTVYQRHLRKMPAWAHGIKFLNLSSLKVALELDGRWTLSPQQQMHQSFFGNVEKAKTILAVSHSWLSPSHADPDGAHLRLLLDKIEVGLFPVRNVPSFSLRWLLNMWKRYYYCGFAEDILVFFDFSSLPQWPRDKVEEKGFQDALKHMGVLYNVFQVVVIDYVPESVMCYGHYVPYLEKGWCWAESFPLVDPLVSLKGALVSP